ncbi:MAG: hypothetical protein ACOX9R_11100 [Armatimonadota bacterium]|jgi:hypothetical protein
MKHLFIDDGVIELREGVERRWYQAVKHGPPVLAPEGPLEQPRLHIWNPPLPAEDGDGWRMWYIGGEELQPLHARSDDGIEWSRPALGPAEAEGGARSNLVNLGFEADRKERRLVLCRPDREGAGPARYLALTRVGGRLKPLESDDGLSWRFHEDHPGIPSDDEYRLGYDGEGGVFIATVKRGGRHGGAPFAVPEYGRTVSVSTSPDGLEWTDPEVAFHADFRERAAGAEAIERHLADDSLLSPMFVDPDHSWTDVYNMPVFRYEGFYLALPVMFHQCGFWQYPGRPDGHNQDGLLWPGLAWSRDLRDWRRPHRREPFIPLSACDDPAIYDNGAIHACAPVRRGDELWFYYYGSRFSHVGLALLQEAGLAVEGRPNGAVYLAKLRLDGFASYHGGEQPGVILTRPVVVGGSNLRINARAEGGEIRAELRDAETGRVIPGFSMGDSLRSRTITFPDGRVEPRSLGWGARFEDDPEGDDSVPFSGDRVDATLNWRGGSDLSALRGRAVRVLFSLRNADLYAFEFADARS